MSSQQPPQQQLAPPRKTFRVETLLSGHIDVLSLLFYLHEKQNTGIRDLLLNMLYDLQPFEVDSILPQLIHLWVRWESHQAEQLGAFFLKQCAHSLHFTLKTMWILSAEEVHATTPVQRERINEMLKLAEMAHVNSEIPFGGNGSGGLRNGSGGNSSNNKNQQQQSSSGQHHRDHSASVAVSTMRRSATQELRSANAPTHARSISNSMSSARSPSAANANHTTTSTSSSAAAAQHHSSSSSMPPTLPLPLPISPPSLSTSISRSTKLVQVNIAPAPINAPINALVGVTIVPTLAIDGALTPSPGIMRLQQSPHPMNTASGSPPRPTSSSRRTSATSPNVQPKRIDGPAAAFTINNQQQSWKPTPPSTPPKTVRAIGATTSLAALPHHGSMSLTTSGVHLSVPMRPAPRTSSPATIRASPTSMLNELVSPDESVTDASVSPHQRHHHHQHHGSLDSENTATGMDDSILDLPFQPSASPDLQDELDVDWPEADQDIPKPSVSVSPSPSTANNRTLHQFPLTSSNPITPQAKESPLHQQQMIAPRSANASSQPSTKKYATLTGPISSNQQLQMNLSPPSHAAVGGDPAGAVSPPLPSVAALPHSLAEPVLFQMLSKQVRSEYFNLELLLFTTLHDLSVVLTGVAVSERNKVLRESLREIDATIIRGLYIPIIPHISADSPASSGDDAHYRILRLLPEDCWSLASRDKAPFLLHVEIEYTTPRPSGDGSGTMKRKSCYDDDLYTAYKSNEQIMRDALATYGPAFSPVPPSGDRQHSHHSLMTPNSAVAALSPATPADATRTARNIAHMKDVGSPNVALATTSSTNSVSSSATSTSTAASSSSSPHADIQANGLNVVSDSKSPKSGTTGGQLVDENGKVITRSRSSSAITADKDETPPDGTGKPLNGTNGNGGSLIRHQTDSVVSASTPTSPQATNTSVASKNVNNKSSSSANSSTSSSTVTSGAVTPKRVMEAMGSDHFAASSPALAAGGSSSVVSTLTSSATVGKSVSAVNLGTKPRTVPAPNPFRPLRSKSYLTGPTLCDHDYAELYHAFGESLEGKKRRIRATSPFTASVPRERWNLVSFIFKGGDDLRQEVLAMQFITAFDRIFRSAKLPLWLKPYSVVITSGNSGLIETIPDALSIDSLKKRLYPNWTCLTDFFAAFFGGAEISARIDGMEEFSQKFPSDFGLVTYQSALRNFVESLAASSIVTYLLQIKDRHNGNIMIDRGGHIINIDYGFMLSNSPGGNFGWEQAPFKLTQEFVDVMGGVHSDLFAYYRMLVIRGFLECRSHIDEFIVLCEVHAATSKMPCFTGPAAAQPNGVIEAMRQRFAMHLQSESEVEKFVDGLINDSIDNARSRRYDRYQKLVSGIL